MPISSWGVGNKKPTLKKSKEQTNAKAKNPTTKQSLFDKGKVAGSLFTKWRQF